MINFDLRIEPRLDEVEIEIETNLTGAGALLVMTYLCQHYFPDFKVTEEMENLNQDALAALIKKDVILTENHFYEIIDEDGD